VSPAGVVTAAGGLVATTGGLTVSAGTAALQAITGTTLSLSGALTMTAAASQLIPGATSFAVRNPGNTQDNLLVSTAGALTVAAGLAVNAGGAVLKRDGTSFANPTLVLDTTGANQDAVLRLMHNGTKKWSQYNSFVSDNLRWGNASDATLMELTQAGNLTVTGKALGVAPAARVFHNGNQSIANNTVTALAFNSERFDNDAIHDTVTNNGRLVCKTAGTYLITGCVEWDPNTTGGRQLTVRLNGTTAVVAQEGGAAGSLNPQQSVTTVYALAVNDFVELLVRQTSGGALNVIASGNYSPEFSIAYLGT
jgi:hypothetical protein